MDVCVTVKRNLKSIQLWLYFLAATSSLLALLSVQFDWNFNNLPLPEMSRPFFANISESVWATKSVQQLLVIQTAGLLGFFGIAIYLGLRILPVPLSEKERCSIINSPYIAFNEIFFKKVLFGSVFSTSAQKVDFRNVDLLTVSDLYLFHFKISSKGWGLAFLASIIFIEEFFLGNPERSSSLQILMNFISVNLFLFLITEFVFFAFSFHIRRKNNART